MRKEIIKEEILLVKFIGRTEGKNLLTEFHWKYLPKTMVLNMV